MNSDIRLQMSFYSNTKIKKLHRALGAESVLSLIYLWLYVAENRPHGELRGMDEYDIAIAAQWQGDAKEFVATLKDMKFLDKKGKQYFVHDWAENNPWAAGAPERKQRAKIAAKVKWEKEKLKKLSDETELIIEGEIHSEKDMLPENKDNDGCDEQNLAMLLPDFSNAPSPSPFPSPLPLPIPINSFDVFWKAYPKKTGKGAAEAAWKKIKSPSSTIQEILKALEWQRSSLDWTKENGQYIPNPSTYLNQKRWLDEPSKSVSTAMAGVQ